MQRNLVNGIVFYQSTALLGVPNLTHAVTTRHGGVSAAPFHSLNLSTKVGDEPTAVEENLTRLHKALGLERAATVDAAQAQADQVARVTAAERGTRIQGIDGLITNEPGVPLMLRFADCVPIMLYDPKQRAIGITHAGWRGTVSHVLTKTVNAMTDAFGTRPGDLIACICPSIGPCCYEIGADVQAQVRAAYPDVENVLVHHNGGVHLDLWQANASQLAALGVDQVHVSGVCTSDHTADFYSWRRENAKTGRFATLISLT